MAYETKVILALLAEQIGNSEDVSEAYNVVVRAANVEGLKLPSYEEFQEQIKSKQK